MYFDESYVGAGDAYTDTTMDPGGSSGGAVYGPPSPAPISSPATDTSTNVSASIFASIAKLGSAALLSFGPQNSAAAIHPHYDPQGHLLNPSTGLPFQTTGPSMTEVLLGAAALILAVMLFGKMK